MKNFGYQPLHLRTSLRLTFLSLVLMVVLLAPVGAQAVGLAQDILSPTPTSTVAATETPTTTSPAPTDVPSSGSAPWFSSPASASEMATGSSYALLAGQLINHGLVNAVPYCSGASGLLSNGNASPCGEQAARLAVINWQNQFDQDIFATSAEYGVPAFTVKNVMAQESQFWPSKHLTIYKYYEYGLGSITQMGADTLLRWNADFSKKFCKQVYNDETCKTAYAFLPASQQAALRGSVLQSLDADCSTCVGGVDLPGAHNSVRIVAATLRANYDHLTWLLQGLTASAPKNVFDSALMWRLSLASYNAGPGCVTTAIHQTNYLKQKLTWKNISAQFDPGCAGAVAYVDRVTSNPVLISPQTAADAMGDPSRATRLVFTTLGIALPTPTPIPGTATATTGPTATPSPTLAVTVTETSATPAASLTPDLTATGSVTPDTATPDTGTPETATPGASGTPDSSITPDTSTPVATASPTTNSGDVTTTPDTSTTPAASSTPTPTGSLTPDTATPDFSATPVATDVSTDTQLGSPHVNNQLVIKIDPNNRQAALDTIKSLGISLASDSSSIGSLDSLVIDVAPDQLDATLKALKDGAGIEYAEPNFLAQLASLPNDPKLSQQTDLWDMQVPQAWDALPSMQEVTVAVLDTGVDSSHPDLADRMFINAGEYGSDAMGNDKSTNGKDNDNNGYVNDFQGWNFVDGNNNTSDTQGHGTHVAGIIGAAVDNAIGIAGVAPNARILPVKVLDSTGYGSYATVAQGIIYATDMGARIIELGFGGTGSSELLQNAINYATAHGALVIAAAGNGGTSTAYYPAAYPGVIAVSALGDRYTWAPFSSIGDHISLAAPGSGILSTMRGGGYAVLSGTSMASANVAGVAALLAGQPQFADADTLRSALLGSALDLGTPGRDPYFGFGAVRAFDALGYIGPVMPTPTPWAVPTSSIPGGVNTMSLQDLWPHTQIASYAINNPANSLDSSFNDLQADITGQFGANATKTWRFYNFDTTSFSTIASTKLEIRYYISNWTDDEYLLQVYEPTNPGCVFLGWCTIQTITTPPTALTTVKVDISSILDTPAKINSAMVRLAGGAQVHGSNDNVTIHIDGVMLEVLDVLPPTPTPTPTSISVPTATLGPRAITATPQANEPHNNMTAMNTDVCASCHRSHSDQVLSLGSQTTEEQICYACHGSGGPGSNLQQYFTAKANTSTAYYSHPVDNTTNVHTAEESTGSSFGGAFRHVECVDCHAPHNSSTTAASATNPAPAIQQEMYYSTGVDPSYSSAGTSSNPAAGAPTGYAWMPTAEREYQVCFKCHSSFTTLPTYAPDGLDKIFSTNASQVPESRNKAQQFNPFQPSFHPLMAIGRNRGISSESFVAGWSVDSMVTCQDCHTNGSGPHASANLHILSDAGSQLCFKCHSVDTYQTGLNSVQSTHFKFYSPQAKNWVNLHSFHSSEDCYYCHDTHGSEQARLINFDTAEVSIYPGYNSQTAWRSNGNGTYSCAVACHGHEHASESYTP